MGIEIDGVNNTLKVGTQPFLKWQTSSIKTSTFTAVSGEGYFVNTTGGEVTVNLPAGAAGAVVALADYAGTWDSNTCTVSANGSEKIQGSTDDAFLTRDREAIQLIYIDSTQGWVITSVADQGATQALYIEATGGTITTCGDYKIHTFTSSGTFTVSAVGNASGSNTVDYMVVAGGGGAGASSSPGGGGGGGGGGGWRASSGTASGSYTAGPGPLTSPVSALPVSVQGYPITVGAGGVGAQGPRNNPPGGVLATNGGQSVFSTITSAGGGFGGINSDPAPAQRAGGPGGSGGGSSWQTRTGGTGNTPPVSPAQGNDGGNGSSAPTYQGGPGGGAVGAGTDLPWPAGNEGASGGAGAVSHITGSPVGYAGGGGGGGSTASCGASGGAASPDGSGGAGAGPASPSLNGSAGATNRGGGGGSGGSGSPDNTTGGAGGSGVVVIRYKYQN